ncbi:MAG: hypothetical protein V4621_08000 [Pseudomonadota bacterium]
MAFSLGAVSNYAAIPSYGDLLAMAASLNPKVASLVSAGTTETLAGNQIAAGIFVRSGSAGAVAATTDTATNILSALGPNVSLGMTFMLIYVNLNTAAGVVTVSAGAGVTLSGTMTVPIAGLRVFIGTVTNVTTPAVTIQGAFQVGANVAA